MNKQIIGLCIITLAILFIIELSPLLRKQETKTELQKQPPIAEVRIKTVNKEAARLRKEFDSVHIYAVSNRFEVWCVHGIAQGKWKDATTVEEARKIVDDYYIEWAGNILGHTPPGGKLIE